MEYTPLQVKKQCENLDNKGKQELYMQVLAKAKNATESNNIGQLKKLSEVAYAIEEASERELFQPFDDENPLREANIIVESDGLTNYLFSLGNSSKLYDLRENTEEALYQAIKSNDVELVKHLLIVLLPDDSEKIRKANLKHLKELEALLSKIHEELKENISQDMKSYLEKNIKFYSFLCDFQNSKDSVELFANQSEPDYQIDKFLLSLILENIREEELLSKVNNMIELLKKHERFDELEYKIRILKSELESGKGKYPQEAIQASIKEHEKEIKEIAEKYIKPTDLVSERKRLASQLV